MEKNEKRVLQNEIYDILNKPEFRQWFIRSLAEIIAKYVILARKEQEMKHD